MVKGNIGEEKKKGLVFPGRADLTERAGEKKNAKEKWSRKKPPVRQPAGGEGEKKNRTRASY